MVGSFRMSDLDIDLPAVAATLSAGLLRLAELQMKQLEEVYKLLQRNQSLTFV